MPTIVKEFDSPIDFIYFFKIYIKGSVGKITNFCSEIINIHKKNILEKTMKEESDIIDPLTSIPQSTDIISPTVISQSISLVNILPSSSSSSKSINQPSPQLGHCNICTCTEFQEVVDNDNSCYNCDHSIDDHYSIS